MTSTATLQSSLSGSEIDFYTQVMTTLSEAEIPYMVGGAFAFEVYTGIVRRTKDLDLFILPADAYQAITVMEAIGFQTEMTNANWLAKAFSGEHFTDFIFSSANGLATVDDEWFRHAKKAEVLGIPVLASPVEEIIWSKAFIMERERYDGADIAHLLYTHGEALDWPRLLRRFEEHWRVLLSYLILFDFIYPAEQGRIPSWVLRKLLGRAQQDGKSSPDARLRRICRGTLLSDKQYVVDIEQWGHEDARSSPSHSDRSVKRAA